TIARRPAAESETLACCATCSSCCRSAGVTITWIRSTLRACVAAIVRLPASPPELLKQFAGCCPAPRSRRAYSRDDDPHEPDPVEVVAPGPVCGNRPARQPYGPLGLKTPRPTWNLLCALLRPPLRAIRTSPSPAVRFPLLTEGGTGSAICFAMR